MLVHTTKRRGDETTLAHSHRHARDSGVNTHLDRDCRTTRTSQSDLWRLPAGRTDPHAVRRADNLPTSRATSTARKGHLSALPSFRLHRRYVDTGLALGAIRLHGLAFYYKPTPTDAYASILFIENEVRFGSAIRAIHHWSANGMVVMVIAHMVRVFITGAFKPPREFNWMSGVLLFIFTFAFGLTGYLLPWDQRAFWATTVATGIAGGMPQIGDLALVFLRGGWEVTAITLSRFYALHVLVLPLAIVTLLVMHFWMVRRQGIAKPL
jgi:hypothetical protein